MTTTETPAPALPPGADRSTGFDSDGLRVVFGPRHPVRAEGRIVTACMQDHDGRIVVSGEEAPGVIVVCDEGLTPAEAREMAERLIDAARLAETWTVTWNRDLKRKSGLAHPCRNAQAAQR